MRACVREGGPVGRSEGVTDKPLASYCVNQKSSAIRGINPRAFGPSGGYSVTDTDASNEAIILMRLDARAEAMHRCSG